MSEQHAGLSLTVAFPETGYRIPVEGDAAQAVFTALARSAISDDVALDDLATPERAITYAAEQLARLHGLAAARVTALFDRIVQQLMPDSLPKGLALIPVFEQGPLSWPRRMLRVNGGSPGLTLLENEDLSRLPGRLAAADALQDIRTPLYTLTELRLLLSEFVAHLEQNTELLARTGHPVRLFARCPWLDVRLNKLYPAEIPVVEVGPVESPRHAFDARYVEGRRVALPLSRQEPHRRVSRTSGLLERQVSDRAPEVAPKWGRWRDGIMTECDYAFADRLSELHPDDVVWLRSIRPIVHQLKIQVIVALVETLFTGRSDKLWNRVIDVIAAHLSSEQLERLFELDEKYQTYNARSDTGRLAPLPCMPGGLSAVIELAGHVEKELKLQTLHRARSALGESVVSDLLGRPRLRGGGREGPYFVLVAGSGGSTWRAVLDTYLEAEAEEPSFWTAFRTRLAESISTHIPQDIRVSVRPKYREKIEPLVTSEIRSLIRKVDDGELSLDTLRPPGQRRATAHFPSIDGLSWEEVTITFISNEAITVGARGRSETYTFSEIGFKDERKKDRPNLVWHFLHTMAKADGELSWSQKSQVSDRDRGRAKSFVAQIRKQLKTIVGIKDDPFHTYRKVKAYRPKFRLSTRVDAPRDLERESD